MTSAVVSDVSALRELIRSRFDPAYEAKMLHVVPDWPVVPDRAAYLERLASGRHVLDIGCAGAISVRIAKAAAVYYGVDRLSGGQQHVIDLDDEPNRLPFHVDVDLVIASEFIEHLANPGRFLHVLGRLYRGVEICLTVPNAGAYRVSGGREMVNKDHVAWYSYRTLMTLLSRYGYQLHSGQWYHGQPYRAEGLIVLIRTELNHGA